MAAKLGKQEASLFKEMCGLRVVMVGRVDCHWCHVFHATFPEFVPLWLPGPGNPVDSPDVLGKGVILQVKRIIGAYAKQEKIPADQIPLPILVQVLKGAEADELPGLVTPASELMSMLRCRGIDAPDADFFLV
jgi:hypothetical protein